MLRHKLRRILSAFAGYLELLVAIMIVAAVVLASIGLVFDLSEYGILIFNNENASALYSAVFSTAIHIVIGIEMIKMIVKHTPASVLEVLLFVIAKRVVAETEFGSLDMLLCVLAIAVIFAIKKFLHFDSYATKDGTTFAAETKISEIEKLLHIDLPNSIGETVGEATKNVLNKLERHIAEGEEINFNDALFRIHSMENGEIKKVEIVVKKKSLFTK